MEHQRNDKQRHTKYEAHPFGSQHHANIIPLKSNNITLIPINPETHVRSTQGDRWLFGVTEDYLKEYDEKKLLLKGRKGGNFRRRKQLERYNRYKESLRWWAAANGFKMPLGSFAIWFLIPVPKSWRPKRVEAAVWKPHTNAPDLDNLLKAFLDGMMPRRNRHRQESGSDDRRIHSYAAFKIWAPIGQGKILLAEFDPLDFSGAFVLPACPEK